MHPPIILLHEEGETLTKDELINAVIKSCKDDNLTKRLAGDVVDAAFENISKAIKKEKRFAYPSFGTFTVDLEKLEKAEILKRVKKLKLRLAKLLALNQLLL